MKSQIELKQARFLLPVNLLIHLDFLLPVPYFAHRDQLKAAKTKAGSVSQTVLGLQQTLPLMSGMTVDGSR